MKEKITPYVIGFTLLTLVFILDYARVACCDGSDQVCARCEDYIEYYFGD